MKAKVTEKGVYDKDGKPVPVGTTIKVNGDKLPGYLVGKAAEIGKPVSEVADADADADATEGKSASGAGKTAVVNPALASDKANAKPWG